jgi:hypothetical protein
MKKIVPLFLVALVFPALCVFSQKYKHVEDTVNLNKEYVSVSNDIAELQSKLTIAQNDLPAYQAKATNANSDAVNAASASSEQAAKATNGNVSDAKSAKKKANKSYGEAKDSKEAQKNLEHQQDKIANYREDLEKKQKRQQELDVMRLEIYAKIPADPIH